MMVHPSSRVDDAGSVRKADRGTGGNLVREEQQLDSRRQSRVLGRGARRGFMHAEQHARGRAERQLNHYQNKLAVYVVDELSEAAKLRAGSDEDSDVGLSLDDTQSAKSDTELLVGASAKRADPGSESMTSILEELFHQISGKVPVEICQQLKFSTCDTYFYELLADHFAADSMLPFVETTLIPKCLMLTSVDMFPGIFAMLLYKYLLAKNYAHKPDSLLRWNILLKGIGFTLWFDVHQQTQKMFGFFKQVRSALQTFGDEDDAEPMLQEMRNNFVAVLCRFYYYYFSSKSPQLGSFLEEMRWTLDAFVLEAIHQVYNLDDSELVRIHYLKALSKLKDDAQLFSTLLPSTLNKLQALLNAFSLQGAPYFPSREVRTAAGECLNALFPSGKWPRTILNTLFHLARPTFYASEAEEIVANASSVVIDYVPAFFRATASPEQVKFGDIRSKSTC